MVNYNIDILKTEAVTCYYQKTTLLIYTTAETSIDFFLKVSDLASNSLTKNMSLSIKYRKRFVYMQRESFIDNLTRQVDLITTGLKSFSNDTSLVKIY
jgi:hypothetical protein